MRHSRYLGWRSVVLSIAFGLLGCNLTTSELTHFYVLTSLPRAEQLRSLANDNFDLAVGVGPIELPGYLDRPQMVTRTSANRIDMAEFEQWAEPLQDSVSRILAANLSLLLSTDHVELFPWKRSTRFDYQVGVSILQFEAVASGEVWLQARWTILEEGGKGERLRNTFSLNVPPETEVYNYTSVASAMSHALGALSRDIAVALRIMAQGRG